MQEDSERNDLPLPVFTELMLCRRLCVEHLRQARALLQVCGAGVCGGGKD